MNSDIEDFGWRDIVDDARQELLDQNYPIPHKPSFSAMDLELPEDIDQFNSVQLSNLKLRFGRWYAYATTSLSFAESERATFLDVYEYNVNAAIFTLEQSIDGKKPAKDVLRGEVVSTSPEIKDMFKYKLILDQRISSLEGLVNGLGINHGILRDEQIRRMAANKIEASTVSNNAYKQ